MKCINPVYKSTLRLSLLPALTIVLLHLCGCSTGFTGDGIPPGRSAILGRVIQAANPQLSVPNATVTITTSVVGRSAVAGRGFSTYIVYTNAQGVFAVTGIGTDKNSSTTTVSVVPQDTTLQSQKLTFSLANGRPTDLIVALPAATFPLAKVSQVVLTEEASTGGATPSAQYKAQVYDSVGNDLGITPSLIFDGGVASIGADGTFTVMPATGVTNPITNSSLGTVTATVDKHQSGPQPITTTIPTLPSSSTVSGAGGTNPTTGVPIPPPPPAG